jgi:putative FmdB family regulatory protein
MPIYAYKCESCGHRQDVLQKMSDPLLTVCPSCGAAAFSKQVTAAGFQLKGSGWYATDFRNGSGAAKPPADAAADAGATPATEGAPAKAAEPAAGATAGEAVPAAAAAAAPPKSEPPKAAPSGS